MMKFKPGDVISHRTINGRRRLVVGCEDEPRSQYLLEWIAGSKLMGGEYLKLGVRYTDDAYELDKDFAFRMKLDSLLTSEDD